MGGVFGHMSHLYDNPNLKFSQIKDIFQKASNGELVGTEKTDGQNLFVSYDIRDGVVRAARNKGNIKEGGLTPEGLADKFAGRGALTETFVDAFDAFALAVSQMPPDLQLQLFGPEANIYYNAEIQDPRSANLINYDVKTLNIHRTGHAEYDKETGNPTKEANENAAILEKYLSNAENSLEGTEYRVQVNAIRNLEKLNDDSAMNEALARLENFTSKYGLSDDNTIGDYLVSRLDDKVSEALPDISIETKKLLMKRMFEEGYGVEEDEETGKKKRKTTLKSILDSLENSDLATHIRKIISNSKEVIKELIFPLEDIIHDFSVEMLKGLESAFVLDSGAEVERQRAEVHAAIEAIEGSNNEEAMEILKQQMKKLKKIENISTAAEGFVFDYDGQTYKFTGNFAPMNQLLGLFKYGRGNVPPLRAIAAEEVLTEAFVNKGKSFMFIPGGFKPPHKGHMHLLKTAVQSLPDAKPYLVTGESPRDDVSLKEAMQVWKIYLQNEPELQGMDELSFITVPPGGLPVLDKSGIPFANKDGKPRMSNSPLQAIFNSAIGLPKNSDVYIVSSTADKSHGMIGESILKARPDLNVSAHTVEPLGDPTTGGKFSASGIREAVKDGDLERFKQFLPESEAVQRKAEYIFTIILGGKVNERQEPEEEEKPLAESFRPRDLRGMNEESVNFNNLVGLVEAIMDEGVASARTDLADPNQKVISPVRFMASTPLPFAVTPAGAAGAALVGAGTLARSAGLLDKLGGIGTGVSNIRDAWNSFKNRFSPKQFKKWEDIPDPKPKHIKGEESGDSPAAVRGGGAVGGGAARSLEEMSAGGGSGASIQGYAGVVGPEEDDEDANEEEKGAQSLIREKEALVEEILNYLL